MHILRSRTAERLIRPGDVIWWGHKKPPIGPEMISNGDFAGGATGWSIVGAGTVAISGGAAHYTAGVVNDGVEQFLPLIVGAIYQVTFTIVSISAGAVRPRLMGGVAVNGTIRSAPGTYTENLTGTPSNTTVRIATATAPCTCDIDNVSCRRVG